MWLPAINLHTIHLLFAWRRQHDELDEFKMLDQEMADEENTQN
jgi:hypothetical protein